MDNISAIGFDMDFTLLRYKHEATYKLTYNLALETLIKKKPYNTLADSLKYIPGFAIRGLIIDREKGNILKMDEFHHVKAAYHGMDEISEEERKKLYTNRPLSLSDPRFSGVDSLFELPEVLLYAQIITAFANTKTKYIPRAIQRDVRDAIDACHRDGRLKETIISAPHKYVDREPRLVKTLEEWITADKQLFLLTNSEFYYTDAMLSYLLNDQQAHRPHWSDYFSFIGVDAHKPKFFRNETPFVHEKNGQFDYFSQGNINELENILGVGGDNILYIGDHIYGDIVQSKRLSHWRTALIVPELDYEIRTVNNNLKDWHIRADLDDTWINSTSNTNRQRLIHQMQQSEKKIMNSFHQRWGSTLKCGLSHSYFGSQMLDFACVYMSKVSNFSYYNPNHYYQPRVQLLPHEQIALHK